jgi:hypothetical protein
MEVVLLSTQMVIRTGKLTYKWQGTQHLPALLQGLHKEWKDGKGGVQSHG